MKRSSFSVIFLLLLSVFISSAHAQSDETNGGLSEATKGGIGCLVISGAAMTAALWVGPSELIMIAAGGTLAPSASAPLIVSLTATLVAASCSVGFAATPAVLWFVEQAGTLLGEPQRPAEVRGGAYGPRKAMLAINDRQREMEVGLNVATTVHTPR